MMRKLLNTIYITRDDAYLSLDNNNLVCKIDGEIVLKFPLDNIEGIVCFNYVGCTPALMGECVKLQIRLSFISQTGRFLANVCGPTKGNVHLRIMQIKKFETGSLDLAINTVIAKIANSIQLIRRGQHDNVELRDDADVIDVIYKLKNGINSALTACSIDELLGIEGNCAKYYFSVFSSMFSSANVALKFESRTKRPPLDPINATLSFVYTLLTNQYAAALETVGLDSYIGYYHSLRSGRASLACDLVEEARCIVERFTITLFNLRILDSSDFDTQISGAVYLSDNGRRKVLSRWQEKCKSDIYHPYLKQKIQFGLLPYIQSNLLAKYIRGELDEYYCFLIKRTNL